jgi:colicin import membrane protein
MAVSSVGHAVILGWGLLTFAPNPLEAPQTEAMPVDLVSIDELTRTRQGKREAPKLEEAKPQADKVEEPKKTPEADKKEKQPEVKPTAPPPPQPEEVKKEVKKEQPKTDPIKDLIVKDEALEQVKKQDKTPPKKEQPKVAEKPKAPPVKQRNFNPDQIAALLDKRQPNSRPNAADQMSPMTSFGVNSGNDPRLSQNDIDALRAQIQACWNPPVGAENAQDLVVKVRVQFRKDGTLSAEPSLLNRGSSPYFQVAAESAMRAVRRCAPYTLPAAKYELWKDVEVTFDPRDMFRGG